MIVKILKLLLITIYKLYNYTGFYCEHIYLLVLFYHNRAKRYNHNARQLCALS